MRVWSTHRMRSEVSEYSRTAMLESEFRTKTAMPPYPFFGPIALSKRPISVYPLRVTDSTSSESHVSCTQMMSTPAFRSLASSSALRRRSFLALMLQIRMLCVESVRGAGSSCGSGLESSRFLARTPGISTFSNVAARAPAGFCGNSV